MIIETVEIDKLKPFERNPKNHPESQLKKLEHSISEFGWTNPILATKDGMVVAGHARLEAAKRLNIGNVPVIYLDMPYEKAIAYVIADNRLAELAETDTAQLSELLGELSAIPDFDIELTGFDIDEVASLNPVEVVEDDFDVDDALADIDEPVTKRGDIILLGRHRLMCGDSTDIGDVERLMDGTKADCIITDPPYGIDAPNMTLGSGKKNFDRGDWDKLRPDISNIISMAELCCVWGGNYFTDILPISNDWLCWYKKNDGLSFSEYELAWTNFGKNCRILSHHWSGEIKQHPTQKPVAVMTWCIEQSGKTTTILDPFMGSGSTIIAAEQTNRICYGMELDPKYIDVCVLRWEEFTSKKATRPKQ